MHGNVVGSNGGRGKISRQRSEPAGSPKWAATPTASTPLALSYIPEILESMATVCSGAERRSLGGQAPVTPETNSHETPIFFTKQAPFGTASQSSAARVRGLVEMLRTCEVHSSKPPSNETLCGISILLLREIFSVLNDEEVHR